MGVGPAEGPSSTSEGGLRPREDDAVESGSDTDRTNGSGPSYGNLGREEEVDQSSISLADALPPAERIDTLTLVSGMEIGGLGVGFDASDTVPENRLKLLPVSSNGGAVDRQPVAARDRCDKTTYRLWPEDESERIWRASLNGKQREQTGENTTTSNKKGGVHADGVVIQRSNREGSSPPDGMTSPSATAAEDHKSSTTAGENREGAGTAQATAAAVVSSSPADACTGTPASASRPGKLQTEVLASMLLSEHEFVGGNMSAADVLERARLWEQQQRHHHQEQAQSQPRATKTLPFPDLPYSFTDLGRRVNVEQPHHRGIDVGPTGASAETFLSLE